MDRLYPQMWMSLGKDVRDVLKKEFKIEQGGPVEVFNDTIRSDGYRTEDLMAVNVETMMAFVEQDKPLSFLRMWELTMAKVNFILHPPVKEEEELPPTPPKVAPWCYYCEAKAFAHRPECTRPGQEETFTKTEPVVEEKTDEETCAGDVKELIAEPIITGEITEQKDDTKKNKQDKGASKGGDAR